MHQTLHRPDHHSIKQYEIVELWRWRTLRIDHPTRLRLTRPRVRQSQRSTGLQDLGSGSSPDVKTGQFEASTNSVGFDQGISELIPKPTVSR